jgi:hypothetical protein
MVWYTAFRKQLRLGKCGGVLHFGPIQNRSRSLKLFIFAIFELAVVWLGVLDCVLELFVD